MVSYLAPKHLNTEKFIEKMLDKDAEKLERVHMTNSWTVHVGNQVFRSPNTIGMSREDFVKFKLAMHVYRSSE